MAENVFGERKLRLSVFLIKLEFQVVREFIKAERFYWLPTDEEYSGILICRGNFSATPAWVHIFEELEGFPVTEMNTVGAKAIYAIRVDGRWFCFTFGHSRHLIDDEAIERNFGLITALNLGDPNAVKAIDKTSLTHIALHSREQAARDIAIEGFEFDTDVDLLKSITAKSRYSSRSESETYSGRDSVSVCTKVDIDEFPIIARKLLRAYRSNRYKERYPWIDKIIEERDQEVIRQLDEALVTQINGCRLSRIWLAIPEVIDWEEIEGFAFARGSRSLRRAGPVIYPDLDLEAWLESSGLDDRLTVAHLKQRQVFRVFKDARQASPWRLYRCLNAEIDLGEKKYILNDGEWYAIEPSYVDEVHTFFSSLETSRLQLPAFGVLTEPDYLKQFDPEKHDLAYMDRKEIMTGGGRSRVEFCDLFSREGRIIHVKRYGGSSVLSHLFNQAVVSADCFMNDPAFRSRVNDLLPENFRLRDPSRTPDPSQYVVCLAIMSKEPGELELPFFSKVSLRYAVKSLRRLGFRVEKLKIDR